MDDLTAIAEDLELGLVVLYGSRARGDARPDSDTDVGVWRADDRRMTARELAAASYALGGALGGEVNVADLATDDAIFRREVARDGRVLYADDADRWTAFVSRALIDYADIAYHVEACIAGVRARAAAAGGTR